MSENGTESFSHPTSVLLRGRRSVMQGKAWSSCGGKFCLVQTTFTHGGVTPLTSPPCPSPYLHFWLRRNCYLKHHSETTFWIFLVSLFNAIPYICLHSRAVLCLKKKAGKGSATMLPARRLAGVAQEVNLRNHSCREIHAGFETRGRGREKSKLIVLRKNISECFRKNFV